MVLDVNGYFRVISEPLKSHVLVIADTSGSMSTATGAGPAGCAGAGDSRLDLEKCAINDMANNYGDVVLGLSRLRQTTTGTFATSCSSDCTITGIDCTACDATTGDGCTTEMSSDARLEVLTALADGHGDDVARWNDFACDTCTSALSSNPELFGAGFSPIAGPLEGAQRFFQGLQASDGTTLWPSTEPGFDPIRNDPLKTVFLPSGQQCRPYVVILLADGEESCTTFPNTTAAAAALLSTTVDGSIYRIETKPIGLGLAPGNAQIEGIAHAGGAADDGDPNTHEGFYAKDQQELELAIAEIVSAALRFEKCNDDDDDCDGLADEDFPAKGQACADGGLGVCRGFGTYVCSADGAGTECQINSPGGTPSAEVCNGLDDDCDGSVDEGCGGCLDHEICANGLDDNCNALVDDGCTSCIDWVDVGGAFEIMKYEASRPDATAGSGGASTDSVCSRSGVLPWTDLTHAQAEAACSSMGARLCTEQEWHRTCSVVAQPSYPINVPGGVFSTTFEAEDYFSIASNTDTGVTPNVTHAWVPDYASGFFKISAMRASPNTGSAVSLANAPTRSPRMDYQLNFAAAGNYRICVRAFSAASFDDNSVHVGINATIPGAPTQTLTTPANGAWVWAGPSAAISVPASGTRFLSVYMNEDQLRIDRIHLTTSSTCPANSNPPPGSTGAPGRFRTIRTRTRRAPATATTSTPTRAWPPIRTTSSSRVASRAGSASPIYRARTTYSTCRATSRNGLRRACRASIRSAAAPRTTRRAASPARTGRSRPTTSSSSPTSASAVVAETLPSPRGPGRHPSDGCRAGDYPVEGREPARPAAAG